MFFNFETNFYICGFLMVFKELQWRSNSARCRKNTVH